MKGIRSVKDCVATPCPTLCDIVNSHGLECACLLVEVFLVNLNDSGNLNRMTSEQISETAELIYEECPRLKLTELYEFVRSMKIGKYGEFYGSMDCIKIMSDFREFLSDRSAATAMIIQEQERDNRERLRRFSELMPAEREKWLTTLSNEEKIEIKVCPACHAHLANREKSLRCISCDYEKE